MPPGHLPLEVYISDLAWKRIGIRQEELEIVAEKRDCLTSIGDQVPVETWTGCQWRPGLGASGDLDWVSVETWTGCQWRPGMGARGDLDWVPVETWQFGFLEETGGAPPNFVNSVLTFHDKQTWISQRHEPANRNGIATLLLQQQLVYGAWARTRGGNAVRGLLSQKTRPCADLCFQSRSSPARRSHSVTHCVDLCLLQPGLQAGRDRPFLRTEGNSPSNSPSDVSPLHFPFTGTEMPCEDFSPSASAPSSVHELRPADINVVAAVGDSLTTGTGIAANNILEVLREYRGLSWSIGGDDNLTTVTTLSNILKYYNGNLTGFSVGLGKEQTPQAFLNQAVGGAKSGDIPSQVRTLVARMKSDSRINFESDWKVITLLVGANDICDHCYNSLLYSAENYVQNVRESLDYLHKQVPRALVNLMEPLHMLHLRELHMDPSLKCPTFLAKIICPCVVLPKSNSKYLQMLEETSRMYQRSLHELVESGRYDTRSDFTVVIQPFLRDIILPRLPGGRPDRSFFSPDCFHLSQKSHTLLARSLWNNMLEPLGNKTSEQDFTAEINLKCPAKTSPYIRTFNNSDYRYTGPPPTPGPITVSTPRRRRGQE
ncbi:phospholipase B1, membrane-associated [Limanda limanda]|uniref:phospholipase B1, membrane-associated n=1 Tax=Limanda limanda TaxID=27771 RepID=UPI0029C9441A|nr:phospholipase B1, membrane-associated [Limanda limanda]